MGKNDCWVKSSKRIFVRDELEAEKSKRMSLVEIFEDDDRKLREGNLVDDSAVSFLEAHFGMQSLVVVVVILIRVVFVWKDRKEKEWIERVKTRTRPYTPPSVADRWAGAVILKPLAIQKCDVT